MDEWTDGQISGRTNGQNLPMSVLYDIVPFGAAAQKAYMPRWSITQIINSYLWGMGPEGYGRREVYGCGGSYWR